MLKDDHKTVERLFKRFEGAGDRAHVEKREIVDRIIEELSKHAAIEEQCFYPVARATVPRTEDIALESLEEHHVVKWMLSELETMAPDAERFDAKVTVLIENVRHHVKEEENDFFPKVRKELDRSTLNELGDVMAAAKKAAPTHPHPRSPDAPPANLLVGTASGVADRITDTMSGIAQGSVTAAGDIIATVLRRKKPSVTATGSRVARRTVAKVRETGSDATDAVIEAVHEAKRAAKRSGRTTRATASSATTGAKRTAGAAKRGATSTGRAAKAAVKGTATSARKSASPRKAAKRTTTTARRGATTTRRVASETTKRTATAAKRGARTTATTAKRSARRR